MQEEKKYIRLDEVTLMRTILAVLIVFMHSFTCYNGGWPEPAGFINIPVYKWLSRFSFAFTLQAFVFLSGYLFAFQRITLKRVCGGGELVVSKLKRLMLPSVLFSILYFFMFFEYIGFGNMVYSIINGCGHMWYLPMLFWCFIGGWLIEKVKIREKWKLLFCIALNIFAIGSGPLQIIRAASFMVYFYGGFLTYKHLDDIKRFIDLKSLIIAWVTFIVLFIIFRLMRDFFNPDVASDKITKLVFYTINNVCVFIYSWSGLIAFFTTAIYYTRYHELSKITKKLAVCCFGIYLLQQFILWFLYYKTTFPVTVGPYWLPWCGFSIAILTSLLLSDLFLKTKTGRFLIG